MKNKRIAPKQKEIRPKIFRLSEKDASLIMEEMPPRYQLVKYQDFRNLQFEHHRIVGSYLFISWLFFHSSLEHRFLHERGFKTPKQTSKNPFKLMRQSLLDDKFQSKQISKKKLNEIILFIKKDKAVGSIKNKSLKQIFTKQIQNLHNPYYKIRNTFDLKCYIQFGFDTYFYNSDEVDAINNKMKALRHEIMDQLSNFKEQHEEMIPVSIFQIKSNKSLSKSKHESFIQEQAVIDFSNAKFQPNMITLARKINLGRNFPKLISQELSKLCRQYFFLKQQGIGSQQSEYEIKLDDLSFRQFFQIEKQMKHYLKQRNQPFEILQDELKPRFVIQDDD